MSKTIQIGSQVLEIPTAGQSPSWAAAITSALTSLAEAVNFVVGPFDVAPQSMSIDNDINVNVTIPLLSFPPVDVRSVIIKYTILRISDTTTESESGQLELVYQPQLGVWAVSQEAVGTRTTLTFNVLNTGIVQFSTVAIGGNYTSGQLSYSATSILKAD